MRYVVVGTGIVGASAAYHLAKAGHHVTMIDRKDAGQATEHAAGIICPWISKRRNKVWYELAKESAKFYPEIDKELAALGFSSGYEQVGTLCLRKPGKSLDSLYDLAVERSIEAPEIGKIEKLSPHEVKERFPFASPDYGAVFLSGGGKSKGALIRDALLQGAAFYGGKFVHASASLDSAGRLFADGKEVAYDKLVLAAGAWLRELLSGYGYEADLLAQKGQLLTLEFDGLEMNDWPVVLPPASKAIVPFAEGRLLLGATHEKEAEFDLVPTEAARREILDELGEFIQLDRAPKREKLSVGTRPYTPDFTPFIGTLPSGNIFLANGLGASGLTTGPFVGKLLAELAAGDVLSFDISGYDPALYLKKLN
ncbi:oxidoreductase, FAD-binding protein [Listeria floridensis FSL S10-1187]|uniref:Oxidoreductase, FAD-binding protein n=1 Tax=Listeria floridensis FSL S10-1187 TaxID=1265817 RepID=A0ABP3B0G8_9LIST|nr:FAD-dependent oxidoreductase [Listeria floridensis]EUJ32947.1 oxidoreductase, FAD-binding protein [Listeria floridensis FSL S10-1187]